jgi:erythronate-4-phosphate dehydrogenase
VATALLCLAARHGFTLEGKTIGIVGVGNVGRKVVEKAEALGLRIVVNDPPRARTERAHGSYPFLPLADLLEQSDIVTLHVPLTKTGPDATVRLAGEPFFARLKPDCLFFNCARGAVTDTDALLRAMDRGTVSHAVMDTWEGEPAFRPELLDRVDLGTPHIAGHSFEGKVMGTVMVFREACRFLGVESNWSSAPLMPPPPVPVIRLDGARIAGARHDEALLWEAARRVYDIEGDDRRMRGTAPGATAGEPTMDRVARFDWLRSHYPMRREFRFTRLALVNAAPAVASKAKALGFMVTP